jgi:hypothetical protein
MTESLLEGLSLEETQQLVLQALLNPAVLNFDQSKLTPSGALRVGTSSAKFRDDFLTFDTTDNWTVIQQGANQTIDVDGLTGGSRYLKMSAGTTAGEETIILSKQSFKMPVKLAIAASISQRIANQDFYLELVEVDDNGDQVLMDTPFAAPTVNNSRNAASILFNGTSTTNSGYALRAQGVSELAATGVPFGTTHSVATGTTPNFNAAFQFEILAKTDLLTITSRAVNSTSAGTQVVNRTDICPNPERKYAIRIRMKNTGTPASNTDFRIHYVRVVDASAFSVDFSVIGGNTTDMMAAPVKIIGATPVTTTLASAAPSVFADSIANLAIGATFTGTARDAASTNTMRRYTANFAGSQASADGGCKIQYSTDSTIWYDAVVATKEVGKPLQLSTDVIARYHRAVMVNGTVTQTGMGIHSVYHRV